MGAGAQHVPLRSLYIMSPDCSVQSSEVDVLIIGAGPAGLMACNALATAGVDVRIIDQKYVRRVDISLVRVLDSSLTDQPESRPDTRTVSILVPLKSSKYVRNYLVR